MELDEAGTLEALKARKRHVLSPSLKKYRGRLVKEMGDGILVEFDSAVDAVECAVALQSAYARANEDLLQDRWIMLRIGINVGERTDRGERSVR